MEDAGLGEDTAGMLMQKTYSHGAIQNREIRDSRLAQLQGSHEEAAALVGSVEVEEPAAEEEEAAVGVAVEGSKVDLGEDTVAEGTPARKTLVRLALMN